MDKMIEVRYAGAVVGRSAIVRELDTQGLFLGITEPMPVGTLVTLKIGDQTAPGKVAAVSESQELARAGMRVRFASPADATLFGTPTEAPAEAPVVLVVEPVAAKIADQSAPVPTAAPEDGSRGTVASGQVSAPRRIVVDASAEHAAPPPDEVDSSGPVGSSDQAHGGEGGKKNRRHKRR